MSNTELREATGEKPIMTNWQWIGQSLKKADESTENKHCIAAGSQKERKTTGNVKMDHSEGSRKMQQNMRQGYVIGGQKTWIETLHMCPIFQMK